MIPVSQKDSSTLEENEYADFEGDLNASVVSRDELLREMAWLFGDTVAEQANHIDIADINMNKEITQSIASGVRQLKELKNNSQGQRELVNTMEPGARILLCLWIMDMDLLDKIQLRSYLGNS